MCPSYLKFIIAYKLWCFMQFINWKKSINHKVYSSISISESRFLATTSKMDAHISYTEI